MLGAGGEAGLSMVLLKEGVQSWLHMEQVAKAVLPQCHGCGGKRLKRPVSGCSQPGSTLRNEGPKHGRTQRRTSHTKVPPTPDFYAAFFDDVRYKC